MHPEEPQHPLPDLPPGLRYVDKHRPTLPQERVAIAAFSAKEPIRIDELNRIMCGAKARTTGELCLNPAVSGMRVCRMHGGSSSQAKKKARLRFVELVDPAIATLAREMVNADKSRDRQAAANSILDRAGHGRVTRVEGSDAREMLVEKLRAMRDEGPVEDAPDRERVTEADVSTALDHLSSPMTPRSNP